jgi:parallel beta-helix repeat protein
MTLPFVPTDSGNEKQHRTVLATTINELVRHAPFQLARGDVRRYGAKGDGTTDDSNAVKHAIAENDVVTFPFGYTFRFNATADKSVIIMAQGAILKPYASGRVFEFSGASSRVKVYGGYIDMTGFTASSGATFELQMDNSDVGILGDAVESLEVLGVRTYSGSYAIVGYMCGLFRVDKCEVDAANQWGVFSHGCDDTIYTENRVTNTVTLDALKCGGVEGSGTMHPHGRIIITGNWTSGNTNDSIDVAINGADSVLIHNNVSVGDTGRLIECKNLGNSTGDEPIRVISIKGNQVYSTSAKVSNSLINIQDNQDNDMLFSVSIEENQVTHVGTEETAAIRLQSVSNARVVNNNIRGAYYGLRLQGGVDNEVSGNTIRDSVRCLMLETAAAANGPARTKIRRNRLRPQGHATGSGNCVYINTGDANEVDDNEFEPASTQYSIVCEQSPSPTSATNTRIGRNLRGITTTKPNTQRAGMGDYWINSSHGAGLPDRWVSTAYDSSADDATLWALGQRGYRTNAGTPSGVLTPQFIGERVFDTSNVDWYTATGTTNTSWAQDSN